jgi:hypothetical protein
MKRAVAWLVALVLVAASSSAQGRDEARPRDVQRLQEALESLDEAMAALEPGDARADEFRRRAEEIREDTIYVKVKMRRHQKRGERGTGVSYDEVEDVRQAVSELREDLDRAFGGDRDGDDVRLAEGTEIVVRLDETLSSRTARREDRFDASVFRPVRAGRRVLLPVGARVRGTVREAEPAQRGSKAGRLEIDFDALFLGRERYDLRARVISIAEEDRQEGVGTAGKAGIGATLGAILGGVIGGSKGAVIGILVGGTGAVVGSKGEEVELPAGTVVSLRLERPLSVSRR